MQVQAESSFLSPEAAVRAAKIGERLHVADFYAGGGFFARAAARAVGPRGRVWAIDPNPELLARLKNTAAAERLDNVEIVRGTIERRGGTLLPESAIDAVMLVSALSSAEDKESVAEEAWRVLKTDGRALVIDWQDSFGGAGPHPSHVVAQDAARRLFLRGTFEHVEDIPAGKYHWGAVFRKRF